MTNTKQLLDMLTYRRPNRSKSEKQYIREYIAPYAEPDSFGNYIARVGSNPRVMFSSHTDTVHRQGGKQSIELDSHTQMVYVSDPNSNCLGADDGTGNWIMLEMIRAGIDGLYVFHRGEEIGGQGSKWISKNTPEIFDGIDYAIAFDRMGESDVVDSQSSGKCCSPEFSKALAGGLAAIMGTDWKPHYGIFTDTANYNHIVSECTNLSVGYDHQHTRNESQSLKFAAALRDACLSIDWQSLPAVRDVTDTDDGTLYGYGNYGYTYYPHLRGQSQSINPGIACHRAMMKFITKNPDIVADYLIDMDMTPSKLRAYDWPAGYDDDYGDALDYPTSAELGPDWEWDTLLNCYRNWKTGELIS